MNLGQAVAVCLYELARNARPAKIAAKPQQKAPATAGDLERISDVLLEALQLSGYTKPKAKASTEERVRRMVRRLSLSSSDCELWLGMLRQMLWKIRTEDSSKTK